VLSSSEACDALADVIGHFEYPIRVTFWYVFRPILIAHERHHKQDYEKVIMLKLPEFENKVREILITCQEAADLNNALQKGQAAILPWAHVLLTNAEQEYSKATLQPDYEEKT